MLFFIVFEVIVCCYGWFGVLFANAICSMWKQFKTEYYIFAAIHLFISPHDEIEDFCSMDKLMRRDVIDLTRAFWFYKIKNTMVGLMQRRPTIFRRKEKWVVDVDCEPDATYGVYIFIQKIQYFYNYIDVYIFTIVCVSISQASQMLKP